MINEPEADRNLPLSNAEIAARLEELASLLESQGANQFRVRAYRTAARQMRDLPRPVHEVLHAEGLEGITKLPGIGTSLARSIAKLCRTDRLGLLTQLRGEGGPEHLFMTLPGVGLRTASRIHELLGVESLPELDAAARDGRLAQLPGMGRKRIQAIQESLAARLYRSAAPAPVARPMPPEDEPPVEELLDVDREYREKAAAGKLRLIAPRRFNPTGQAWLPVMHTHRGKRHYTALFSNTARAHELGVTRDWVVVYRDDPDGDGQWTVITSQFGRLRGKRIIRGREDECAALYQKVAKRKTEQASLFPSTKEVQP